MADKGKKETESGGGTATVKPRKKPKADTRIAPRTTPAKKPPGFLPPWKVLLHNDDKNSVDFVIVTIVELTPLNEMEAKARTTEADKTGVALLLVTHKERAELYQDQFQSKGLTVTIEPAEQG